MRRLLRRLGEGLFDLHLEALVGLRAAASLPSRALPPSPIARHHIGDADACEQEVDPPVTVHIADREGIKAHLTIRDRAGERAQHLAGLPGEQIGLAAVDGPGVAEVRADDVLGGAVAVEIAHRPARSKAVTGDLRAEDPDLLLARTREDIGPAGQRAEAVVAE